ncbi:MAG: DUF3237 family protein [Erythrobacter sp.]|nr:DUF3237 family protein [Erythrobacter sp.]
MRKFIAAAIAMLLATPVAAQEEPPAPRLVHVFTIVADLGPVVQVGETGRGNRRIIPITGGTVEGPGDGEGIHGTVRPGAWDWQLDRPDGCLDLVADYFLETDDGAVINVRNTATACPPTQGEAPRPVLTRPQFEPPLGAYAWLGHGVYVGALTGATDRAGPAVQIRIYRVE